MLFRSDLNPFSFEAHGDAVWDISWTTKENAVVSISADGIIKCWNSSSGQVMRTAPAHTLGLVSLSVSPDGRYALYNSVDGTTFLWDLEAGAMVGKHESYTRPGAEPCKSFVSVTFMFKVHPCHSLVRVLEPKGKYICCYWWLWKCNYPLSRGGDLR